MKTLPRSFYNQPANYLAIELLGKVLVRQLRNQKVSGRIVEVEAYLAEQDEAAHAFKGETKRNKSLFTQPGNTYIYSIHQQICFDVVAKPPTSVLIRALEPLAGIEYMRKFRKKTELKDLTSGPGKLAQALNLKKDFDGMDLTSEDSELAIVDDGFKYKESEIVSTKRIGISKAKDFEYRFYIKGNPYISKGK